MLRVTRVSILIVSAAAAAILYSIVVYDRVEPSGISTIKKKNERGGKKHSHFINPSRKKQKFSAVKKKLYTYKNIVFFYFF